jgi:hypothetical protein
MNTPKGALYFYEGEPHIIGYLVIGKDHYELVGVRRSKIRTDIAAKKMQPQQTDLFDDGSGDGAS